ncbi:MFS transporter [Streptomyces sp. NBC_01198]|uniref:MFS transporter n=1 Tax=Streptomyces sp. NBC_01198 TaxID=2903769 RepID=UPI002E0F6ADA|nr:MFS transporter [Streptomyces sp. NBC_01198]
MSDQKILPTGDPPLDRTGEQRRLAVAVAVIAVARFMVVLDGTIMIVALPRIGRTLSMSGSDLAWVINAYSLTFGGLMLVAGRVGDLLGRKRVFRFGIVFFGAASLAGGLAPTGGSLIVLRALQGVGAAIATPGALSLLVSTFPIGPLRTKALGVYGAATGMASVMGLLLGGLLTTYLGWRWVLFVNVPIAALTAVGVRALDDGDPTPGKLDLPGATTETAGVGSLVFAVNRAGEQGWSDPTVITCLGASAVLLLAFVLLQRSSSRPMIPRGVLAEPGRARANVITLVTAAGMFATFYFLTLYLQQVHGYSALRTGLFFLPFAVGFGIAAGGVGPQLLARTSERAALSVGLLIAAGGMIWFSFLTAHSNPFTVVLPASLVTGIGLGATQVVTTSVGVRGIDNSEAGVGSSLLTAGSQIGSALGLAVLATVASAATRHRTATNHAQFNEALTHGYTIAFIVAAGIYLASLTIAFTIKPLREPRTADGGAGISPTC